MTTRRYTLKRRAERQAETRQRIVQAAIDLHGSVGPGRTTLSMVAERAGVQRNTLYAHFPDEWALALACSGTSLEADPLPDAETWRALPACERLRTGLGDVYGWYERNAGIAACVLRDAEWHDTTRRITELRIAPSIAAWNDVLGKGRDAAGRAMLRLALDYHAWRSLAVDGGLGTPEAVQTMARAVERA